MAPVLRGFLVAAILAVAAPAHAAETAPAVVPAPQKPAANDAAPVSAASGTASTEAQLREKARRDMEARLRAQDRDAGRKALEQLFSSGTGGTTAAPFLQLLSAFARHDREGTATEQEKAQLRAMLVRMQSDPQTQGTLAKLQTEAPEILKKIVPVAPAQPPVRDSDASSSDAAGKSKPEESPSAGSDAPSGNPAGGDSSSAR